uniref:translation initiation factor IF3-1, mitochondrial n=1 Tax=Erigeron canadensis TaxID=72917 RepID=UPI001CB97153|nr:translation initiation factor IF3-1, mitochondrial [Erigeron canadensis]
MVLFGLRTKQAQLRALSKQFTRCYFQIYRSSSVIREGKIGVLNGQSLNFYNPRVELDYNVRFYAAPAVQVKPKYDDKDKRPRMNEEISAQYVRLVTDEGHGVVSKHEALQRAKRLDVDLVEVQGDANPPVCKLMDYNKEMYAKQVREKEQTKKKSNLVLRKGGLKEVRITYKIDKHDLQTKADTVKRLADRGYRVKCMSVMVAGVQVEDQDLGGLLSRLFALIEEFSIVESGPKVEAKQAYVVVRHVKFGPLKKGPGKKMLLEPSNSNISAQSPEPDQSLDESDSATKEDTGPVGTVESDSADDIDHERMVKFAPKTTNRYAAKQSNVTVPGPQNRYAATGTTFAHLVRRNEPESPSQTRVSNQESDLNRRGPGVAALSYGMFGAPKPNNDSQRGGGPQQLNRYKKGPSPQQPPMDSRGGRGDFSRENSNMDPNGIRDRKAGAGFRR